MQIADLARQYISTTTSKDSVGGARGIENLVSSVRDLTAGNIFEGTVNSVAGGKVILGLSNGRELTARLDASMQLVKGQSMFFQVKSNDGATIAIRPYTVDGAGVNLTLLNALKAANLPVTDKFLSLANGMMQEQMPIDKNSMANMARILMANPDMSVNTLIQMKKLDIPISNEMIAQFENYVDDNSAVHKALDGFIMELPTTLTGKDLPMEQLKAFDSELLMILAEGTEVQQGNAAQSGATLTDGQQTMNVQGNGTLQLDVVQELTAQADNEMQGEIQTEVSNAEASKEQPVIEEQAVAREQVAKQSNQSQENVIKLIHQLFGETTIQAEDSPAILLNKLSHMILNGENVSKETLNQLFSSKDMQQFLKDIIEEQMYLKPEDVANGEKVKKLYEKLENKTQKLEALLMNANLHETPLAQTVADVRGNVEFMNQLNQTYTYVQIPLKMAGQNASGQLYVYTNKRDLGDPEKDLTAFLHLDMDNLGSTDVSVRLNKKDVDTKFYMDSDEAYALVKAHMPELEERLRMKGFNAKIYVENEGKKVNFVEDFLKKDVSSAGQLHRYSFDVRA